MTETKYSIGEIVLVKTREPGGVYGWTRGLIMSYTLKFVGEHAESIKTPEGHEVFEGRILGPLYWVAVEGSRLNQSPKWEFELKPLE